MRFWRSHFSLCKINRGAVSGCTYFRVYAVNDRKNEKSAAGKASNDNAADSDGSLQKSGSETVEIDPVCRMKVLPAKAAATFTFAGSNYYFCNPRCKRLFEANPQAYLAAPASESRTHGAGQNLREQTENTAQAQMQPDTLLPEGLNKLKAFYLPESVFSYTCPMDPEVIESKPGSCPICGMQLSASIELEDGNEPSELAGLTSRLLPCAILTGVLLAISMPTMFAHLPWLSQAQALGGQPLLELALASPVVLWGGLPIFSKALTALRQGHMNMFTLIAFGVLISFAISLASLVFPGLFGTTDMGMTYFESAAGIVTLVLVGQILEVKARTGSNKALESLFSLAPGTARRVNNNAGEEQVPVYAVTRGDRLRVLPGDKIPADGLILSGCSSVDESIITGNALPVTRSQGENVIAGTMNLDGSLLIEARSLGRDTLFAQMIGMLVAAQASRSPMQEIADRVSAIFIPAVLAISALTFAAWMFAGGTHLLPHAVQNMVAVLVIACPCALGLATPIAVSNAVARASKAGLLVKDARGLEMLALATDILIDKTGTLSRGRFELTGITTREGTGEYEALRWAASLEKQSKHPLAASICRAAESRQLSLLEAQEVKDWPGQGLEGLIQGHRVLVGSRGFMRAKGIGSEFLEQKSEELDSGRQTAGTASQVCLGFDGSLMAVFTLSDALKAEAPEFIKEMRTLSLRPAILSGDGQSSVAEAGRLLGVAAEDVHGDLLPQNKVEQIRKLQQKGKVVAMVGDGINDAAALAAADAGIAMSSGSDVALTSAAINIMKSDLQSISKGVKLARLMTAVMKQNLFLAFIYNALAIVAASGALYPSTGIELNPAIAAGAMSLSSLSVIINSTRIISAKL